MPRRKEYEPDPIDEVSIAIRVRVPRPVAIALKNHQARIERSWHATLVRVLRIGTNRAKAVTKYARSAKGKATKRRYLDKLEERERARADRERQKKAAPKPATKRAA